MSPLAIILLVLVILLAVAVAVLVWIVYSGFNRIRRAPVDPIMLRLMEHHEALSRDRVAETERVLAALVEQTRDSNQHMSGIMTHDWQRVPNEPEAHIPTPTDDDADQDRLDMIDPTDWGTTSPIYDHAPLATFAPGDTSPFGIEGLEVHAPR